MSVVTQHDRTRYKHEADYSLPDVWDTLGETYHRRGFEAVEPPARSYCHQCHAFPEFVVWHDPEWLCTSCASPITVPA